MKFIPKSNSHWKLALASKILRWVVVSNLAVLAILWILRLQYLFIQFLAYEALFILFYGVLLILSTYVYRKDSIPSARDWGGYRTGWFDYKRFAKLKPEERQRYRLEGKIMIVIALALLTAAIVLHFSISQ